MILKAPKHAGANFRDYSGVCARRGCISTTTEAKVPEAVLWLQSGHAQHAPHAPISSWPSQTSSSPHGRPSTSSLYPIAYNTSTIYLTSHPNLY